MQPLITNARRFPDRISSQLDQFAQLTRGQRPQAMFISCSDSRVMPSLVTSARPGDIFELRNAGNIIPRYRPQASCAVAGTLEFAVQVLNVPDIVVWGHSHCGAVQALTGDQPARSMPLLQKWLGRAGYRRRPTGEVPHLAVVEDDLGPEQQHLVRQFDHLRSYPRIAHQVAHGKVRLHAWYYAIDTAQITTFHPKTREFRPL